MKQIVGCDSRGAVHTDRADYPDASMPPMKRWLAEHTNPDRRDGKPGDVIDGADVFIGLSGARVMPPDALARMNGDAMVFAMANPNPEVTPEEAEPYARVIATGRSDYPNQINNVLCFPGIFRGALDVRAREITEEMKMAAARGIASIVRRRRAARGLHHPLGVQPRRVPTRSRPPWPTRPRPRAPPRRTATRSATRAGRPRSSGPSDRSRRRPMRVTITGASGLIGSRLRRRRCDGRGDEVTTLSRDPARGVRWDPPSRAHRGPRRPRRRRAPRRRERRPALDREARKRIRESRELGTHNLVAGSSTPTPRPTALISSSAVGYYGPHGDERLDEDTPAGDDFLAQVCVAWEREAQRAEELGLRVVRVRTGVVLDPSGGALAKMLLPFKLGVGGPVAGGRPVHAVDPPRRRRRHLPRRARRRALDAARSTPAPPSR